MSKFRRTVIYSVCIAALICATLALNSCLVTTNPGENGNPNCNHIWVEASCTQPAHCKLCDATDGEPVGHIPEKTATCISRAKCSVCRAYYGEIDSSCHRGGEATCTKLAICEDCNTEYGSYSDVHSEFTDAVKVGGKHYFVCADCHENATEPVSHELHEGICPICGYDPQIPTESKTAEKGAKGVTITLCIKDNPGILGLQIKVEFDDVNLHLTSACAGEAMKALDFNHSENLTSGFVAMFDGLELAEGDAADGEILTLTFDIDENAPEVDFQITFSVSAWDNDLEPVNFKASNSTISVTAKTTGGAE